LSDELPQGWATARISELCDVPREKGREGVVPYLEIGNVDIASKSYVLTDKPSVKGCRIARKNDVLVSKVRPTRGAITWIREEELQVSSAFTVLRNRGALAEKCLWQFLAWNRCYLNHLGENCTGTMYPTTSDEAVVNFKMPLPPFAEQQKIVAKLEKLLGKVDASQQRLARIPPPRVSKEWK
jgi:restriction endonuclease S subunit